MYRNKQGVDKHVANITGRIRDEKERLSRGYQFSKLYFDVKEYEIAKRYLAGFLTVQENYAPAHKLMGQILEKLQDTDKAIAAFKCSLEIDNNQKDVLIKICELYSKTDVDPDRARYWAERAEKTFGSHPTVFRLKEKMYATENGTKNSGDLEHLITSELVKHPGDAKLRAKLLRLFVDTGRINEAYTHAVDVEKRLPYADNLDWYQCLLDVYQVYEKESGANINGSFRRNLLLAEHSLVGLTLEKALVADAANSLHRLDQSIYQAEMMKLQDKESKFVLNEVKAQFFFHAGTLILKRAQQDHIGWKEACNYAALCYLYSHCVGLPNIREPWLQNMTPESRVMFLDLHNQAAFRISQTGHMIKVFCSGEAEKWISKLQKNYGSKQNLEKFYETLFTLRQMKASKGTSFLVTCTNFTNFNPRLPDDSHLLSVDKVAYKTKPENLHQKVWLALQYFTLKDTTQPAYDMNLFDSLLFSAENLNTAGSETLCQLDIMAFFYGVVYCAALSIHERLSITGTTPVILPASIMPSTVTPTQSEWWGTAYRLFRNITKEQLGRMRQTLQRGLECIRLIDDRGMSARLSVHLAKTFEERANDMKAKNCSVEAASLEDRSLHYWRKSLVFLERLRKNQNLATAKYNLFPMDGQEVANDDIGPLVAEGRYFIALCQMNSGQQEEALKQFEQVFTVEAAFYQSQIYRQLAEEEGNTSILNDSEISPPDGESQNRQMALLERARDSLYMAMDRTKGSRSHKLIPKLSAEIDDIEARIARVQQGGRDRSVSECSEDGSVAPGRFSLIGERLHETPRMSVLAQSTPRIKPINLDLSVGSPSEINASHVRPSPERLDAQMRAIAQNNDMLIKHVMRQNEKLEKEKLELAAELKESRDFIEKLKEKVENLEKKVAESTAAAVAAASAASAVAAAAAAAPVVNNIVPSTATQQQQHQAMLAAAASPDPRVRPPMPGIATAPHLAFYAYSGQAAAAAFSPHGYPVYAPPHMQYGYPSPTQMHVPGLRPTAPQMVLSDEADDGENDYRDGDDYEDESAAGSRQIPDSQLIQDWPYGSSVGLEGKSTLTYSPTQRPMPDPFGTARTGMAPLYPGSQTMPGPGYFSSPERPSMVYNNTNRYSAPHVGISPGVMGPKPGILAASAATPPTVATSGANVPGMAANFNLNQLSKVGQPIVQHQPGSISAVEPPGSAAIATGQKYATNFPIIITSSLSTAVSSNTETMLSTSSYARPAFVPEYLEPDDDDDGEPEDWYQGPDFDPIIPLPDEVEVMTGEEEERVLFVSRAKLFRFIEKQWKERGVGEIKILYKEDSNQARIVMRREQVLKVCANQYIQDDATIDFKSPSERKTVTWKALDYSDDEPRLQQFCCRFKTEDLGQEFKAKFEEARDKVKTGEPKVPTSTAAPAAPKTDAQKPAENLFDKFKPKAGSWECTGCYVVNPADVTVCPACQTLKPGATPPPKPAFAPSAGGGFKISTSGSTAISGFGSGFGASTATTTAAPAFGSGFGASTVTTTAAPAFGSSVAPGFSFGSGNVSSTTKSGFGQATPGFGQVPATVATTTPSAAPVKPVFSFAPTSTTATNAGFTFTKPITTTATSMSSGSSIVSSTATSNASSSTPSSFTFTQTTATGSSVIGQSAASKEPVAAKPSAFNEPPSFTFGVTTGASKPFSFGQTASSTPASDMLKNLVAGKQDDGKSFGGFTFSSTPVISDIKEPQKTDEAKIAPAAVAAIKATPEKDKNQPPKANIFANFSFKSPTSTAPADSSTKTAAPAAPATAAGPILGTSNVFTSFSDLAKAPGSDNAFGKPADIKGFGGVGKPVFGAAETAPKGESGGAEVEDGEEEYEPDVDFKPVVPLPALVDVKTGEEDEEKLFSSRVKLFRHDTESKQWKERGVGELKILRHRETKRCRILMRREQVLKLCANHFITKDLKLSPLMSSDKAWCWFAQDFSEGEVSNDQLAVRFKTKDIAQQFKEVFEKCLTDSESVATATRPEPVVKCPGQQTLADLLKSNAEKEQGASKPAAKGFGDAFKAKSGQWECNGCYVQNAADVTLCPACGTLKPGATPQPAKEAEASVKFGAGISAKTVPAAPPAKGFSDIFKPKAGAWECQGCYVQNKADVVKCVACDTLKPGATEPAKEATATAPTIKFGAGAGGGFTISGGQSSSASGFGASSGGTNPGAFGVSSTSGFGSGTSSGPGFSFTPAPATTKATATTTSGFTFGSTTSSGFSFSMTPIPGGFGTPSKTTPSVTSTPTLGTPAAATGGTSPLKYVFGQDNTSFSFTPVTPQPRTRQDSHRSRHDSITKSPDVADEYYESEGDDSHIYFEPLVHLEKVEVKTGEEDEDTLYCHRAKLYRFTNGEWKERGLGDVKLLKHKQSGKVRILMRREKILKLCLNHRVTPDLLLKPMANADGKAWVWFAIDCSEGEPSHEQFAIRFKTKEIANDFEKAFDSAKSSSSVTPVKGSGQPQQQQKDNSTGSKETGKDFSFTLESSTPVTKPVGGFKFTPPKLAASTSAESPKPAFGGFSFGSGASRTSPSVFGGSSQTMPDATPLTKGKSLLHSLLENSKESSSADVEITGEDKPNDALRQKARGLQLPETFYNYKNKAGCKGCAGCDECDDEEDTDLMIVKIEAATQDQVQAAEKYQLPKNFYMYETAKPCPGCIGCRDENEDVFALIGKSQPKKEVKKQEEDKKKKTDVETSKPKEAETSKPNADSEMDLFSKAAASSFSFADLAAKSDTAAFKKEGANRFSWVGTGTKVFGQQIPTVVNDDAEDGEVAPSQDIHFEPLVQLPEVEVKTGEENEDVLYSQRAKLFRFTEQQWKERGIGEFKLLRHKETGRIRILMRREQIYKLCCNHNMSSDLVLKPMATSETAWCWNAMDYTDPQGSYEHFAIKFKTKEIALKFKDKFEECRAENFLTNESYNNSAHETTEEGETSRVEDISRTEETDTSRDAEVDTSKDTEYLDNSQQYEGEYDDDDEYEDENPIFQKRATLSYMEGPAPITVGMGELRISIDEDINGARILMEKDDGTKIINHIICKENHVQCNEKKKFCEWTAKDYSTDEPVKRTFRVNFSSTVTVSEFRTIFQHGKELAADSDIHEL